MDFDGIGLDVDIGDWLVSLAAVVGSFEVVVAADRAV